MHDPVTGAVWGGVRRDGIDLHSSLDIGAANLFADLGAGELSGRNVASNQEFTLRTGFTMPVYRRANALVSTGLVGNAWHYTNNLRFYSLGQGGYYSPQRYLSLGVPLEWLGRRGALKWDLSATVGVSNSYERNSPYYPNGLPAGLGAAPGLESLVNAGSSTRGVVFSYGLAGVVEYRVDPHLVLGGQLSIDRSHAFDGSPVRDDYETLAAWYAQRASIAGPVALYYNTISLHDGNRLPNSSLSSIDSYPLRVNKLMSDFDRFADLIASSGRRAVIVFVPEHGAALRGDANQVAGLREIPTPRIVHDVSRPS